MTEADQWLSGPRGQGRELTIKGPEGGTWLVQLVERVILDLGVLSSSPTLATELTFLFAWFKFGFFFI